MLIASTFLLYDFTPEASLNGWTIVDDVVMGGRSNGRMYINESGNGVFEGSVSLENNGGFSSIRYAFRKIDSSPYSSFALRLKGDGKKYQLRVRSIRDQYYSYVKDFETTGLWETIIIPFNEMYPAFRGRKLNIKNYDGSEMMEISLLIGNKTEESFQLEIDRIELR